MDVPIGWSTDQYNFAYAPDGTKFALYDPAMWDYDDKLKADAAAQKAADAAAAAAADEPDHSDVGVYTYHHEDQFNFHHDSTVPHHIPTTKISADIAAMHPHIPTHGVKVV